VRVDKQWVSDIPRDNRQLINVDLIDVIYDVDAFTLGRVSWLDNPHVLPLIMLFKFLEMGVEITELIRKDVSIRDEVILLFSEFLLHLNDIYTESVFSGDLIRLREMIDLLELVETFINVRLATCRRPQNVPFMAFCMTESVGFKSRAHHLDI